MQVTRTAANQNRDTVPLVSDVPASNDLARRTKFDAPKWNKDTHKARFDLRGTVGTTLYDYGITLSAAEILSLVDLAIPEFTADSASRAVALGAAASLRELIVPKEPAKPKK